MAAGSSRHGLEIRAAAASDAPFLAALLAAGGLPTTATALAERLEAIRRDGGACLIATDWGPPSGVIALHWMQPLDAPRTAVASLLLVEPAAQRRGVGRLLLKAGSQAARAAGCDLLQLGVPPDAPELAAFCRETGFSEAGVGWSRPLRRRA